MDFFNTCNVSYVSEKIVNPSQLSIQLLNSLQERYSEEAVDAPFCSDGEYDLEDLEADLPPKWTLKNKNNLRCSEAIVTLARIDYNARRTLIVDELKKRNVNLLSENIGGGIYSLFSSNCSEFGAGDFYSSSPLAFHVLFVGRNKKGEEYSDAVTLEEFSKKIKEWANWLESPEGNSVERAKNYPLVGKRPEASRRLQGIFVVTSIIGVLLLNIDLGFLPWRIELLIEDIIGSCTLFSTLSFVVLFFSEKAKLFHAVTNSIFDGIEFFFGDKLYDALKIKDDLK